MLDGLNLSDRLGDNLGNRKWLEVLWVPVLRGKRVLNRLGLDDWLDESVVNLWLNGSLNNWHLSDELGSLIT